MGWVGGVTKGPVLSISELEQTYTSVPQTTIISPVPSHAPFPPWTPIHFKSLKSIQTPATPSTAEAQGEVETGPAPTMSRKLLPLTLNKTFILTHYQT